MEGSTSPEVDIRLPSTELSSSDPSANSERIKSVSTRYLQQTEMKLKKIDLNQKCTVGGHKLDHLAINSTTAVAAEAMVNLALLATTVVEFMAKC